MENILVLEHLGITYQSRSYHKEAVEDISLGVRKGEVFGFLGPNGAGKTSTIKAILNLIPASEGTIQLFGRPPHELAARSRVGYMPEIARYYWYLTPAELLHMYAGLFGINRAQARQKTDELLALVGLAEVRNVLMKHFSKGMMQKVSLAQALINDPELLILDEPTSGLDPIARMNVRGIIKQLREKGTTIFFSSHELSEVEVISDRVGIVSNGRLITVAAMADILDRRGAQSLEQYFFNIIAGGVDALH